MNPDALRMPPRLLVQPPQPRQWSREEFFHLAELGAFEGRRSFLCNGVILEEGQESPAHACCCGLARIALDTCFGHGGVISQRSPLDMGSVNVPIPDLKVLPGNVREYTEAFPTTATLVVEVADGCSLAFDTTEKARRYAAAGILDYWVMDIPNRKLHVYRTPQPDPSQPHGHGYADVKEYGPEETVSPLAAPDGVVKVSDLLP